MFFGGYPDLARWQVEYGRHSRECGFTSTVAGRRWQWEWNAKSEEDVDPDAPFCATNRPPRWPPLHDEAVLLMPNDMQVAVAIADIARKEMVAAFLDVFPNAPTLNLVEPKIGSNWGDLHFMNKSVIDAPGASSLHFHNSWGAIMPPPQPSSIST